MQIQDGYQGLITKLRRILTSEKLTPSMNNSLPSLRRDVRSLDRRISPQPFDDMIAGQARHNLSCIHGYRTYGMHDEAGI